MDLSNADYSVASSYTAVFSVAPPHSPHNVFVGREWGSNTKNGCIMKANYSGVQVGFFCPVALARAPKKDSIFKIAWNAGAG